LSTRAHAAKQFYLIPRPRGICSQPLRNKRPWSYSSDNNSFQHYKALIRPEISKTELARRFPGVMCPREKFARSPVSPVQKEEQKGRKKRKREREREIIITLARNLSFRYAIFFSSSFSVSFFLIAIAIPPERSLVFECRAIRRFASAIRACNSTTIRAYTRVISMSASWEIITVVAQASLLIERKMEPA